MRISDWSSDVCSSDLDGEDEMLVMIAGEAVLVEDDGRTPMRPGDIAVWPKGSTNGHHLINESDADCVFVALGGGKKYDTGGGYSDIDMLFTTDGYTRKDGTHYPVRSEERSVGKACVSTCRSRGSP